MIKPVPNIASMSPYQLATLDSAYISLAQNESAFPPSPKAIDAASAALVDASLYSDPDWTVLRSAIADVHHIDSQQIVCGAGSMELIGALLHTYSGSQDQVLGTQYGYMFVKTVCQQTGASYIQAAEENYTVSVDNMLSSLTDKTRIVFVCNPGNPTGTRISSSEIVRLRNSLPESCLLIVDQAYGEFDLQDHSDVFALVERGNTVIVRTFSKAYCMAGMRVGWAYASLEIVGQMRKLLNPNNISNVALKMATAAITDQQYLQQVVTDTARLRDDLREQLQDSDIPIPESHTNFLLLPAADENAAGSLDSKLKHGGFIARNMAGYGLGDCIRITVGTEETMQQVARILLKSDQ